MFNQLRDISESVGKKAKLFKSKTKMVKNKMSCSETSLSVVEKKAKLFKSKTKMVKKGLTLQIIKYQEIMGFH
jgi:hypothetical protein